MRLRAGAVLWHQDAAAGDVWVVCRGAVSQSRRDSTGELCAVGVASRGSVLGLEESLGGDLRWTTARVLLPGHAIRLESRRVRALLSGGGAGALSFGVLVGRSARRLQANQYGLRVGSIEQRVARLLLLLVEEGGLPDARGRFLPHRLNRTQIADLVGCRLESLVRLLRGHPTLKEVQFLREGVLVPLVDQLEAIAGKA